MIFIWRVFRFKKPKWFTRAKQKAVNAIAKDALEKALAGIENEYLNKPESEATHNLAQSASSLIESLRGQPSAIIKLGQLLLVKATNSNGESQIKVVTLSPILRRRIDEKEALLQSPESLLGFLAEHGVGEERVRGRAAQYGEAVLKEIEKSRADPGVSKPELPSANPAPPAAPQG